MKKLMIVVTAALALTSVFAEDKPNRQGGGRMKGEVRSSMGERPSMTMRQPGLWVARMMSNKANLEKVGVTDEETQKKIMDALSSLKEKSDSLEKKIRDISREQAQMMRGLYEGKEIEEKDIFEKIDEVAKLRGEQGRLSVKAILALRDNLSKEQFEKASGLIFERGRTRGQIRRNAGKDGAESRREPSSDRKRNGKRKSSQPKD